MGFGSRVSEITLGAAKRNTESGAIFDAKEAVRRAEQEAEHHTREVLELFSTFPSSRRRPTSLVALD